MIPAHITRLMTFAQHGQPRDYGGSDMMRADLEALLTRTPSAPPELRIGKYRLWQNAPSKTSIYRDDGEGGVFNTADLEQAIGGFYGKHF